MSKSKFAVRASLTAVAVTIVVSLIELVRATTFSMTSGMKLRPDAFGPRFVALLLGAVVSVFVISQLWTRRRK